MPARASVAHLGETQMGIDVYAQWDGQTKEEKKAQFTGFNVMSGHVGYLREAYHGGPYATQTLAPECWAGEESAQPIPAATLRARLPKAIAEIKVRYRRGSPAFRDGVIKSFTDFVELCERKERETGKPVTIYASY